MTSTLGNEKLLTFLQEVEEAAEDVLSDRQEIVDLDRKRQATREALRVVGGGGSGKVWMAMSNSFIKLPSSEARDLLQKDQVRLDSAINVLRSNLKVKLADLADKEGRPELKGLHLRALDADEMAALIATS